MKIELFYFDGCPGCKVAFEKDPEQYLAENK